MPKWKDFVNVGIVKTIATAINPLAGVGVGIIEAIFIKPKKKVEIMIDGNKSYIGLVVGFAAIIAKALGYEVPVEAVEGVTSSLTVIIAQCGFFLASIGVVHKIAKATK